LLQRDVQALRFEQWLRCLILPKSTEKVVTSGRPGVGAVSRPRGGSATRPRQQRRARQVLPRRVGGTRPAGNRTRCRLFSLAGAGGCRMLVGN